uniref:Uncharacterized protein LOC8270333 isoform X3 n=1 Tax=Rhizophora mucronata TaxID=61149 RepID=A0A2P2KC49_RHIMU
MAASIGALSSFHLHPHHLHFVFFKLSLPSLSLLKPLRTLPPISCSLSSSSSSSLDFDISFAPPKPKPKPQLVASDGGALSSGQLFIPWIVRGEDGNLRLQDHPPARLIHSLADSKTQNSKRGKEKEKQKQEKKTKKINAQVNNESPVRTAQPKWSKAARRFYNENFRASPQQRLSKVLAAAGVASRRTSEELIFDGRVTVNGSVCNTPQTRVDPARDVIYVNGNRLPKKLPPKVYLALNKPKGYICSSGEKESKSVMPLFDDYLKSWHKRNPGLPKPRLFTVGRLDVATTGLIIATNDGMHEALPFTNLDIKKKQWVARDSSLTLSRSTVHIFRRFCSSTSTPFI